MVTADDLLALPRGYGRRYELIRGGLVEKTGTGDPHDMVLVRFTYALADYVATSNYGDLRVGEPGYLLDLDPDTVRCPDLAWIAPGRIPPHERAVGATFLLRVPLPARFNGEYDPANRPSSTPPLLKPGDRRRFTKPGKTKAQVRARPPKEVFPPEVKETPKEQREHEGPRQPLPEQIYASKRTAKDRREKA